MQSQRQDESWLSLVRPYISCHPDSIIDDLFQGAGISVQAGIPDFRSPSGLFNTLKRDNPKEGLSSGKDLFNASVFGVSFR